MMSSVSLAEMKTLSKPWILMEKGADEKQN
jgi:hypothetical protein